MSSYYQNLVKKYGEDYAKEQMRKARAAVKTPGGFHKLDKEKHLAISRLGGQNRWKNHEKQKAPTSQEAPTGEQIAEETAQA